MAAASKKRERKVSPLTRECAKRQTPTKRGARVARLALLCALCVLLTGCQGSVSARRGDASRTLYIGVVSSSFPSSYMPWFSRDGVAPTIASMVYSTLLSYDESADAYRPALVQKWWYVDRAGAPLLTADGKVDYDRLESEYGGADTACIPIRFELNRDATWSDGVPVTAEDVYFTFDLAANQKLSNHAGALAWVNDLMHKYDSGTGRLRRQGIFTYDHGANEKGYPIDEKDRDYVFYFETAKVLGAITPLVSTVLVLPKHIYADIISYDCPLYNTSPTEELTYAYQHPVGCGAFALDTENSNGQEIVLRRWEDFYQRAEDGGALYRADTLRFILYQDVNVAIYALKKGHLDVLDTSVSANYATLFENEPDISLLDASGLYTECLVLNLNAPDDKLTRARARLKNPDVRRAIALAIDQDALIDNVLNGSGSRVPSGLIPSTNKELYAQDADLMDGDMTRRLAQANALLDTLYPEKDGEGYRRDGEDRLSFSVLGSPGEQEAIAYLQVLLQKIGVEVTYAAKGSSPENTYLYAGNFDMTLQGVVFSASNADIMFNAHFVSLNRSSNYGRLSVPEIARKISQMRVTLNRGTKYSLIRELEKDVALQYYKLPLYAADVLSVARTDRCGGWVVSGGQTAFNLDSLKNLTWKND